MPARFFSWPPFKLVALDADTGQPLDPTVGMRVYREFYDVKKDKNGKSVMVAHKTSVNGNGSKAAVMTEDKKKNGNGGNGKGGGEEKKEGGGGGGEHGEGAEWTSAQDAKLKKLKAEGKTWAEIGAEVGHSKKSCQSRFKEIKDTDGGDEKKGNNGGGEKKDEKKDTKADKNNDKGGKKSAGKAPSKAGSNGEARFTMGEWMTLQEDDLFSFGELQCLSELIMRDEQQRWLRISSAFADKTGRRVHSEDIREKFEEMGRMG